MPEHKLDAHLAALIVDASDDAIIGMALDGTIVSWNAGAERLLGRKRPEALGRKFGALFPEGKAKEGDAIVAAVKRGEHVRRDAALAGLAGATVEVSLTAFPVMVGGKVTGAAAMARDIGDRKALEEKLREGHVLESLGLLAGGIAHDFNNLLTVIMGNASVAKSGIDRGGKLYEYLDDIEVAAQRAADLAGQMLAYSGRGVFLLERVDLNGLVHEMSELLRVSLPLDVEIRYDLASVLPKVEADVTQIRQVAMNLVINAAQAIGEKPGTISVSTRLSRVDREFLAGCAHAAEMPEGDYVVFSVSDSGCGMDAATRARIFDPFFTTKRTGRGLGLSAVLGIVRGHRGAIRVDSEPGRGTTFTVLFPAGASLAPRVRGREGPPLDPWRGVGTVLVVDDEDKVRSFAKNALEALGFRVTTAADGIAAIDTLRQNSEGVIAILLDLTMPRMGGAKALPELRKIRPDAKIVLISGYNEAEAVKGFDGGADGFLKKPFGVEMLRVVMKRVLGAE